MELDVIKAGDCIDLMRELPDECAHLVIADPPYNIGPQFGNKKEWRHSDEWVPWCNEWLTECVRLLRPDGQIFVYGIHHYIGYIQVALYERGLHYRRQVIWYYENGWTRSQKSLATHYEPIMWFSKSANFTFYPIREPYKSEERLRHPIYKNGKQWVPNPEGRLGGDVWKFPTLAGRRFANEKVDHPTQKPMALTDRIVRHFSNPGDLVLVPFAGSGTECVSAAANDRHFWGADLNPDYVRLARERLEALRETA